ncbi:MAG: N-acetyl-gamma-glutamyl-phosphate reductase [Chloroflexota bacterium]|nr:N-acetyl-gamma-glutamyl-phosphate reductase [Chloroflexota bacterium]
MKRTTKIGIINVTGYIGMELARLVHRHPDVELVSVTGRSAAGQRLSQFLPHFGGLDLMIEPELGQVEVAFSALPHRTGVDPITAALDRGTRVVDVSADFRLDDPKAYEQWYGFTHSRPELLNEAVYGLVELNRARLPSARLVANPGCYPTGAILALAPAVREGLIEPEIVIDSKSGVSGAGRGLTLLTHFAEANENVSAYALGGHRHLPEIVQELSKLNPALELSVTFVPHVIPMNRGILTTCYARLTRAKTVDEVREVYQEFYRGETFVSVADSPPQTKQTWASNTCLVYPTVDTRTDRLIVISCIDNLVKGGAGQAVQCMNLMLGLPEARGLDVVGVYP